MLGGSCPTCPKPRCKGHVKFELPHRPAACLHTRCFDSCIAREMATKECLQANLNPTTPSITMAALCVPELPAEVVCASDSADDQDFWEELGKPSSQGEKGSTSRRMTVRRSCTPFVLKSALRSQAATEERVFRALA